MKRLVCLAGVILAQLLCAAQFVFCFLMMMMMMLVIPVKHLQWPVGIVHHLKSINCHCRNW